MSDYKVKETSFGTTTSHPSYGTMLFSRRTGGKTSLFGSSIEHRDTIVMTLHHANITREFHEDRIFGDEIIAEVEMSYSQFAEAITAMNIGTGTPVTVRFTEKDGRIPGCDFIGKREQFVDEFKKQRQVALKESHQIIEHVSNLFNQKKSLTKADKQEILDSLSRLNNNMGGNMDFIVEQFNEQMEKTIMEAKGE